eukprot:7157761-Alexandrium_andersonii.AAC.1
MQDVVNPSVTNVNPDAFEDELLSDALLSAAVLADTSGDATASAASSLPEHVHAFEQCRDASERWAASILQLRSALQFVARPECSKPAVGFASLVQLSCQLPVA